MSASTPGDATCFMPGDPSTLRVQQSPIAGNRQDGGCFTAVAPLCRGTLSAVAHGGLGVPTPPREWGLGARGPLWGWGLGAPFGVGGGNPLFCALPHHRTGSPLRVYTPLTLPITPPPHHPTSPLPLIPRGGPEFPISPSPLTQLNHISIRILGKNSRATRSTGLY
jgi:hypothetical protein